MTTSTQIFSTSDQSLNQRSTTIDKPRSRSSSFSSNSIFSSEELLVEKLDTFISSLESRLNNFEKFFKFNNKNDNDNDNGKVIDEVEEEEEEEKEQHRIFHRRSSSSTSLKSIKEFSINNLDQIHQRLKLIRSKVLSNSFTNLENLYKLLDDQYNYLFNSNEETTDNIPTVISGPNKKEILSKKIITTMQYFDEKLLQIDDFIKDKQPQSVDYDYSHNELLNKLKFFNFNKALKYAESRNLHYYELPLIWRENKYIIHGYRFSLNHSTMLRSIFKFNHNESMNIWSHLIGLGIILYIALFQFPSTSIFNNNNTFGDNLIIYFFLIASIKCLITSSIWHTYSCFAHYPTRQRFACIDYTGITVLITCSIISVEYCALYQHKNLLKAYIIFSTLCGLTGFIFNWSPYFDKPECRSIRIAFFVGLAGGGATTFFFKLYFDGFLNSLKFFLPLTYKSFIWYMLGVVFYGGLIPERWRYDVIIEENNISSCQHNYDASDVLLDKMGMAGEEEIEQIEDEVEEIANKHENENDEERDFQLLIDKHFKSNPIENKPFNKNFMSLWWVDYFLASHNIWHICVVLGILGHYSCLIEMFKNLERV
ncbi:unnamed protein product [Candida verbasci]|uniref:ADIPOR-like receptor IZH3 n=1 Tax=Candida verbasci TaxID=1227364 RepID=A0A9W4XFK2_9ASCO|nr:unnamed protein product [Candida verbasci]